MNAAAAHRAAGDRDKEASALETALRINATNSEAAAELATLLQNRGENDRAIAVLTAAAAATPLDPTVQWMLAEALWTRGEKEEALQRIARAAKLAPENNAIWDDLRVFAYEMQRPEVPAQTAAQLVEEKPGNPLCWLALAATESDLGARLTAIQKAIAVDPTSETAYDRKAIALTEAGRYIEALEACGGPHRDRRPSLALRGREVWVRAQQGDLNAAIERMTAILRDEPNYGWGWYQLCQWYAATSQNDKYRGAATELTRISPDSALAWNYLGEAETLNKNVKPAEECFRRALELDPGNVFASLSMIDIHIESKRVARAAELLEQVEPMSHHPAFKLKGLEIAILRRKGEDVRQVMSELVANPALDPDLVQTAITRARQAGHDDDLAKLLSEAARTGVMNPAAAGEHIRIMLHSKKLNESLALLEKLRAKDAATGQAAAIAFLDTTASRHEQKWLDAFCNLYPQWAIADTEIWGMIGYVLVVLRQYHRCVSSMADWANRKGVRPVMLLNLALSYRNTGKDAEGAKVNEFALQLPEDPTTAQHRVWVAFDAALSGNYEQADKRISAIAMDQLNVVHQSIARLVWALVVAARERTRGGKWRRAASEQLHLILDAKRRGQVAPIVAKYYKQTVRELREEFAHGMFETLWAWKMGASM
jgi:tetratricopeptide (TPR) repeat protein